MNETAMTLELISKTKKRITLSPAFPDSASKRDSENRNRKVAKKPSSLKTLGGLAPLREYF